MLIQTEGQEEAHYGKVCVNLTFLTDIWVEVVVVVVVVKVVVVVVEVWKFVLVASCSS